MSGLFDTLASLINPANPGGTAAAPAGGVPGVIPAPAAADPAAAPDTGTILARLRQQAMTQGMQPQKPMSPFALGALPDVRGKTKGNAFVSGLSGGINAGQARADAINAQQRQGQQDIFSNWKEVAGIQNQADALAEKKKSDAALADYYKGIVANGAKDKSDDVGDAYKVELARTNAAGRFGLRDPALLKVVSDPNVDPDTRAQAVQELARRKTAFDTWDQTQPWTKKAAAAGGAAVPAVPGATTPAPVPAPAVAATATPAPAALTPPAATPPVATPAPAAPATPPAAPRRVRAPDGRTGTWDGKTFTPDAAPAAAAPPVELSGD